MKIPPRYGLCRPQLLLAILLFHAALNVNGQSLSPAAAGQDAHTQTVSVTVTGHNAGLLSDLKAEDFRLSRGGKPLAVATAQLNDDPSCVGILVDKSGSMRSKLGMAERAIMDFVRASNPGDRFFVVNFNDDPYLDLDFTSDSPRIEDAILRHPARGGTAVYDAVWAAADHLQETASCAARMLLVVTDGGDNASRKSLQQTVEHLKTLNALSLFITNISDYDPNVHASKSALETLAGSVNGELFYVSLNKLDQRLQLVAGEARNRYTLTYTATNEMVNASGPFEVKVHTGRYKDLVAKVERTDSSRPDVTK
jgi:Ca-activated chloride channel family protein